MKLRGLRGTPTSPSHSSVYRHPSRAKKCPSNSTDSPEVIAPRSISPLSQEDLLKALAATGKPLIVVLQNGSALAVNWAQENANAILEAWYPGEEGGNAIAETLAGD